jgi:hypothetical protein
MLNDGGTDSDVDKCQKQTSQTFKMSHEMNFIGPDGIELEKSRNPWLVVKVSFESKTVETSWI